MYQILKSHGIHPVKTWSGDRRIELQKITREDGRPGRDVEIHRVIDEMEEYLEEIEGQEGIKGKSVGEVLREKFMENGGSVISKEEFEFIMSYRWG